MRFQCQQCNAILELDDCLPGELVQCDSCGAAVSVPASPASPGAILGEFAIKRELGVGGMGTVFLAHQVTLDRDVALKILKPSLSADASFIENFVNEARAVAAINHPNIVQAYAVQCEDAIWYFAMEYVDGPTLKSYLEEHGALSYDQVVTIASEMVSGLKYAWETRQMIHRDIKPDNIMLTSNGRSKLADLGLAMTCVGGNNESGELYGTPQYLAPELALGFGGDVRSDIYSLGATLYQLISGEFPYTSDTAEKLVMEHLQTPLRPLLELVPSCPAPFAMWIENMLVKRPAHRYQSYEELEQDLNLVKAGQMPGKSLPAGAQIPIDVNSADPLALPEQEAGASAVSASGTGPAPSRKKTLKLSGGSSASATGSARGTGSIRLTGSARGTGNFSLPSAHGTGSIRLSGSAHGTGNFKLPEEELESSEGASGSPQGAASGGKGKLIAVLALVVVLLAGGGAGAFFFLSGDTSKPEGESSEEAIAESVEDGASGDAESQNASVEAPGEESVPAVTLEQLEVLVKQDSAQAFVLAQSLYEQDKTRLADIYTVLSPLVENRLVSGRQLALTSMDSRWAQTIEQKRAEKAAREEAARKRREAEERKRAEEKRLAEEKARKEAREKAIAEAKRGKLTELHGYMAGRKFTSSKILLLSVFKEEDETLAKWRESWQKYVESSEQLWNALSVFNFDAKMGVKVPGVVFYKPRRNATSENDNYKIVPFAMTAFSEGKVTLSVNHEDVLRMLPSIHRRKFMDDRLGTTVLTIDYDLLLPEQQITIAKVALKKMASEVAPETVPDLVASYLLASGNYLYYVFESDVFADFRNLDEFWNTVQEERQLCQNPELWGRHRALLTSLLKRAQANRRNLSGKIYEATLQRYLYTLGLDFAKADEENKQVMQQVHAYLRGSY